MVPARVIELEALPVTPNGKCDRNALPAPSLQTAEVAEPQTDTERELAAIWTRVLRIDASHAIGRDADFFALGGHSLLATQVNAQINLHWSLALPLRTLFDARTRCSANSKRNEERSNDIQTRSAGACRAFRAVAGRTAQAVHHEAR
jgi:hypothetical protein